MSPPPPPPLLHLPVHSPPPPPTARRPWAPGIVMEIGVYLTLHVACSLVTFIGWDVTSDYSHFWDSRQKTGESVSPDAFIPLSVGGAYGAAARDLLEEFALVRAESSVMHHWMLSHGMRVAVASPGAGSTIDASIPRVELFGEEEGGGGGRAFEAAGADSVVDHPAPAIFSIAPLFCPAPSAPQPPPTSSPCVTVTHPQDGFAFTQLQREGPLEWR